MGGENAFQNAFLRCDMKLRYAFAIFKVSFNDNIA